jgi:hypothetical protein
MTGHPRCGGQYYRSVRGQKITAGPGHRLPH